MPHKMAPIAITRSSICSPCAPPPHPQTARPSLQWGLDLPGSRARLLTPNRATGITGQRSNMTFTDDQQPREDHTTGTLLWRKLSTKGKLSDEGNYPTKDGLTRPAQRLSGLKLIKNTKQKRNVPC